MLAEKVIKIAQEKNIPLKDDPELMSILFKLDLGDDVPQEFYKVITEILTFVYNVSKKELSGKIAN
ncbi:EscU/YscU/HrcU family type III secretion system export apparatus switch protein [bacterium]|nr:EscU/YscU/HrcU family type III secretion system export apparatus switch protein [bacterium]